MRHEIGATFCSLTMISSLIACLLAGTSVFAESPDWQSPESISASAESFLLRKVGRGDARTTVRAGQLDPRHRLARCDKPLEPFMRDESKISSRAVVGVRCAGSKPWKVYLPVDVIVTGQVQITRRALPRGHLLTADDIVAEERDVSRLIAGYSSDASDLIGQRLKYQLIGGQVITPAMLQADIMVKRGQSVTLTVNNDGINISMLGEALMDGALNQRIRVENNASGRVVEGVVRSPEHVEVLVSARNTINSRNP